MTFGRAASGRIDYDKAENVLQVTLTRVAVEYRDADDPEDFSKPPNTGAIEEWPIRLKLDALFGRRVLRQKVSWLTYGQLRAEEARRAAAGDEKGRMEVAMAINEKASTAVAVLAFAFLAVPLGIKVSRR